MFYNILIVVLNCLIFDKTNKTLDKLKILRLNKIKNNLKANVGV